MLDERKKRILQAIIEEYIGTAEPVSSSNLMKNYGINFSSATIRNEMNDLEQIGFLEKTHTSSGRIPSAKGYRFYVDELLEDNNLSFDEIAYIRNRLQTKVNEIEELTKIASNTLSEITHYTSIATGPKLESDLITDIKFVLLGTRVLMAVILTETGTIKESIIKFDSDITQLQVENLSFIFNEKLRGKSLAEIDLPMEKFIASEMNCELKIIKPILQEMNKVVGSNSNVFLEGKEKFFDFPEFNNVEVAKNMLKILDTKELVYNVLTNGGPQYINVYIGNENEYDELKNLSIITFTNLFDEKDLGTIGIIGPTRMDYSKVISVMKYIQKVLNERWNEMNEF